MYLGMPVSLAAAVACIGSRWVQGRRLSNLILAAWCVVPAAVARANERHFPMQGQRRTALRPVQ
jgi:hypothetical protein